MDGANIQHLLAMILYMLAVIAIGIVFARRANKDAEAYFLGGRSLGPWVTAFSAEASDMSGYLLMGLPGLAYWTGLADAGWTCIGLAIGTAANWILCAKRLRTFSKAANDSITLPQYLTNRFAVDSRALQLVCALIFLFAYTIYVASALVAGTSVFTTLFPDISPKIAMFAFLLIIVAYTFFGGFAAVCWTDFFQGLLMMAALMLVPIVVYFGHSELLDPTALETVYEYTDAATGAVTQCAFGGGIFNASWQDIVSGLGWGLGYFGMPHILVRFMSIEKPSMIKKSSIVAIIWVVISLFSAVMIAYFGRMIMGEELLTHGNQKLVFIAMSRKFFPAGICGLLLAAIIAASISTADSQLLVASSSFTADLYKPFFRKGASEKETLLIGRVLVLVLSLIAFAIANSKGSGAQAIMDMVENAWGAFGSSFGPTILLSLFWKRFNYKGAVAGVVSGFVVDLGWLLSGLTASTGVYEIVPGFIVSFLAAYLVARFTEAPNAEAVAIFEEATKPDAD
mgnify:CR=1 FL=1